MLEYVVPVVIAFIIGFIVCWVVSLPGRLKRRKELAYYKRIVHQYQQVQSTIRTFKK